MDGAKPKSTRFWLCILGVLAVIAVAGLFALHAHRQTGAMVQVTQGGEVVDVFPLSQSGTHRYESSGGYNIVEIRDGKVAVIEGVKQLTGPPMSACDLRAGAAMIVAGLAALPKRNSTQREP